MLCKHILTLVRCLLLSFPNMLHVSYHSFYRIHHLFVRIQISQRVMIVTAKEKVLIQPFLTKSKSGMIASLAHQRMLSCLQWIPHLISPSFTP